MPVAHTQKRSSFLHSVSLYLWMALGALLAAIAIRVFIVPNQLIDGGVVGIALIIARLYGDSYLSWALVLINLPFMYLAYAFIRRNFVIHMLFAVVLFAGFLYFLRPLPPFTGESLEIIVFGGALLGVGVGMIIRHGGCTDGTEILAILINRKQGFTVGQVVLFINVFIFVAYGWIFKDWHIALRSLMMYIVAFKMIDLVIVGLDELKSALIISSKPRELAHAITNEIGLGLTIIQGKGGYSGNARDILFVIVERLDLSELKEVVLREDPKAFMAIEDLHEVVYGRHAFIPYKRRKRVST